MRFQAVTLSHKCRQLGATFSWGMKCCLLLGTAEQIAFSISLPGCWLVWFSLNQLTYAWVDQEWNSLFNRSYTKITVKQGQKLKHRFARLVFYKASFKPHVKGVWRLFSCLQDVKQQIIIQEHNELLLQLWENKE